MKDKHYESIVSKVTVFVNKIDGDDVNEILRLIDNLDTDNKYSMLIDELDNITNIMWCEYGSDYGKTQNWENTVIEIMETFKNGYNMDESDLTKLIQLIEDGIKE